jgi:hypothetical protein
MQVFWAATDSALTSRRVPNTCCATAATPASSSAAAATVLTVAAAAVRAGTEVRLVMAVTVHTDASTQLVVQADAQDVSEPAVPAAMLTRTALMVIAEAQAVMADCSAAMAGLAVQEARVATRAQPVALVAKVAKAVRAAH